MNYKKYYSILKCNGEKTGDWFFSHSRLEAAQYFAVKKQIPLKKWLEIYKISK